MGCCVCVPQDKISVIETCGAFTKEAGPGFHCLPIPGIWMIAGTVSTRITPLTVNVETKTRDNVFLTIIVAVQFRVKPGKVYEAYYTLTNPVQQITSYIYDVIRATVPKMGLDEVFESKQNIAKSVLLDLREEMGQYGFEILDALVIDVSPDERVRSSMNEINASKRLRQAAVFKSEAAKLQIVKAAEGEAEAQYLRGIGIAKQRKAIIDGMKNAVNHFQGDSAVSAKAATDLILVTQYFDTLKDIAKNPGSRTVFFNEEEGANAQFVSALRQGVMQATATSQTKN